MKNLLLTTFAILGLATVTIAQVPNYVPTNGLVAWWPFNNNVNDQSINGYNGTNNGVTFINDRFGNTNSAISFNGTSWVVLPNQIAIAGSSSRSIFLWVKYSGSSIYCFINTGPHTNSNNFNLMNTYPSSPTILGFTSVNNDLFPSSGANIGNNQWHLIGVTYNSTTNNLSLYVDGVLDNYTTSLSTLNTIASSNYLGRCSNPGTIPAQFRYTGLMDDVGIWNRVLTQQEISVLYTGCANSVTTQPTNQSGYIGVNKSFVVVHSGSNINYQWQSNPLGCGWQNLSNINQYTGAKTNSLSISGIKVSNHNQPFRVISSDGGCIDTSNIIRLTVSNIAYDSLRLIRLQNDSIINLVTISSLKTDTTNKATNILFLKADTTSKGKIILQLKTDLANKHDTVYITSSITSDTLKISIHTGISPTSPTLNSLKVYPNPASTILNIELNKPGYFIAKLTGIAGQTIITPVKGTIDISSLTNGTYILTIYDSNNKLISTNKVTIAK